MQKKGAIMYKKLIFLILIFIIIMSGNSCARNKEIILTNSPDNSKQELQKLFFWRVRSKVSIVYILGSIHVGNEDMFPLNEMIEVAYDASDTLVVELDPEKVDKESIKKYLEYPDGDSLQNNISRNTYIQLLNTFAQFGVSQNKISKMKPSAVVTSLIMLKLSSLGYDPEFGIDKYYLDDARKRKKILQLETPEQQLKLMDSLGESYIEYSLQDISRWDKEIKILINAWKTGDTKMVENFFERCANYPGGQEFLNNFIYKRNIIMVEQIEKYLKSEGRYFVVVGAAHLVGKNGIISLLKKTEKYQVVQMADFKNN